MKKSVILFIFLSFVSSGFAENFDIKGNVCAIWAPSADEDLFIINKSSYEDAFRVYILGGGGKTSVDVSGATYSVDVKNFKSSESFKPDYNKTLYEDFDEFKMWWSFIAESPVISAGKKWKSRDEHDFAGITRICILPKSGRKYHYIVTPNDEDLHIVVTDFEENASPW